MVWLIVRFGYGWKYVKVGLRRLRRVLSFDVGVWWVIVIVLRGNDVIGRGWDCFKKFIDNRWLGVSCNFCYYLVEFCYFFLMLIVLMVIFRFILFVIMLSWV